MVFPQLSQVANGRTFSFWAGGHIVYFMCVISANIVLLRSTHNWTSLVEIVVAMQVASFFVVLYLDATMLTTAEIAYFLDEYFSSPTAWLGVLLFGCILLIEKAVIDSFSLYKGL